MYALLVGALAPQADDAHDTTHPFARTLRTAAARLSEGFVSHTPELHPGAQECVLQRRDLDANTPATLLAPDRMIAPGWARPKHWLAKRDNQEEHGRKNRRGLFGPSVPKKKTKSQKGYDRALRQVDEDIARSEQFGPSNVAYYEEIKRKLLREGPSSRKQRQKKERKEHLERI